MRINYSSGNCIRKVEIASTPGKYEVKLSIDADILQIGMSKGVVVLYVGERDPRMAKKERMFFIGKTDEPLPTEQFKYYFYLGTVVKKGWHIFELV